MKPCLNVMENNYLSMTICDYNLWSYEENNIKFGINDSRTRLKHFPLGKQSVSTKLRTSYRMMLPIQLVQKEIHFAEKYGITECTSQAEYVLASSTVINTWNMFPISERHIEHDVPPVIHSIIHISNYYNAFQCI